MKKTLLSCLLLILCIMLTGFVGTATVIFEGKIIENETKLGVGNVFVTLIDPVVRRTYTASSNTNGIWTIRFDVNGQAFENDYSMGNVNWLITYSKDSYVFVEASVSRATKTFTAILNPFYTITAYVTAAKPIASSTPNAEMISYPPAGTGDITLVIPTPDKLELKMNLIPAGSFVMGSPENEVDRDEDEGPMHRVDISRSFFIGIYEVTQAQWEAVMGTYPVQTGYTPNAPVTNISWEDCQKFITEINTMGIGTFRLPTEAEWEYACRAGTTTRFSYGDDPGYSQIGQYACCKVNSFEKPYIVAQKKPNPWGLYDMHGNVFEWCSDWKGPYKAEKQTDPQGTSTSYNRVQRGGSWNANPRGCRSAFRSGSTPTSKNDYTGFRLVRISQ